MKSLSLGRLAGIQIKVHWTFALLIVWILISAFAAGESPVEAATSVAFILSLFGCVLLHELGHALAARRYGISTRDITLLPIGGVARLERMPREPVRELVIAVAGPAVNVAIAGLIFLGLTLAGAVPNMDNIVQEPGFAARLMAVNIALVVFNLIPAFPMDGGRMLRAGLGTITSYVQATRIAAAVGQVCALGFVLLGFANPILFFIAIFVFFGAAGEAQMVQMRERLAGVKVRDGMLRRFQVVQAEARLQDIAEGMLDGPQRDYPVIMDGRYTGILRRCDLLKHLNQSPGLTAKDAMQTDAGTVDEDESLNTILDQSQDRQATPVMRDGELVGLLDFKLLFELIQTRSQVRGAATKPPHATVKSVDNGIERREDWAERQELERRP